MPCDGCLRMVRNSNTPFPVWTRPMWGSLLINILMLSMICCSLEFWSIRFIYACLRWCTVSGQGITEALHLLVWTAGKCELISTGTPWIKIGDWKEVMIAVLIHQMAHSNFMVRCGRQDSKQPETNPPDHDLIRNAILCALLIKIQWVPRVFLFILAFYVASHLLATTYSVFPPYHSTLKGPREAILNGVHLHNLPF